MRETLGPGSRLRQILNAPTPDITVADIPAEELEKVLSTEGWPPGSARLVQAG